MKIARLVIGDSLWKCKEIKNDEWPVQIYMLWQAPLGPRREVKELSPIDSPLMEFRYREHVNQNEAIYVMVRFGEYE